MFGDKDDEDFAPPKRKRRVQKSLAPSDGMPIAFVSSSGVATHEPQEAQQDATQAVAKRPDWEKHTKGIGFNLLQKMGFKGRLGKSETGMSAPVTVDRRPDGLGLGFGSKKDAVVVPTQTEETRKVKRKRFFANVEQMRAAVRALDQSDVVEPVIELEPAELRLARRLLADLETATNGEDATLREAKERESDERERGFSLRSACEEAQQELEVLQRREAKLREFRDVVQNSPEPTGDWLERLEVSYPEAWALCGFSANPLEASGIANTLRRRVESWQPEKDPDLPVRWHNEWRRFENHWPKLAMQLFDGRAFEVVRRWEAAPTTLLALCFSLKAIGLLDQSSSLPMILAQRAIAGLREQWAPELARLLPKPDANRVREAVVAYLKKQVRAGKIDVDVITAWKVALPYKAYNQLVSKEVPKQLTTIAAVEQIAVALDVGDDTLAALIISTAARLWQHKLKSLMLTASYLDVAEHYLNFRTPLQSIADTAGPKAVIAALECANTLLDTFSLALDHPTAFAHMPDPPLLTRDTFELAVAAQAMQRPPAHDDDDKSPQVAPWQATFTSSGSILFQDVVERFAAQNDVLFVPKHGRFHDGKQLFSFAGLSVYIDHNLTFVLHPKLKTWRPVALEDLLALAAAKVS